MSTALVDTTTRRRISAQQRTEIRRRYRNGDRLVDIANDYGVGTSAISYHVSDIKNRTSRVLAPCGTKSAYDRHRRRDETIDDACRAANTASTNAYNAARRGDTTCATRDCTRAPARQHDSGYCADCHDAQRDDQESPRELTGGRWVTGRHGIKHWKRDRT